MSVKPRELVIYETSDGKRPFEVWFHKLKSVKAHAIILKRFNRVRLGNLGDAKSVGEGVFELRIDFGPGYRVYFGEDKKGALVVLLCGGDKSTQTKDIKKAQEYWLDYLS